MLHNLTLWICFCYCIIHVYLKYTWSTLWKFKHPKSKYTQSILQVYSKYTSSILQVYLKYKDFICKWANVYFIKAYLKYTPSILQVYFDEAYICLFAYKILGKSAWSILQVYFKVYSKYSSSISLFRKGNIEDIPPAIYVTWSNPQMTKM